MNTMKSLTMSFSVVCLWAMTACGNSSAVNTQTGVASETKQTVQTAQPVALSGSTSKIQAELDRAKQDGKAVFVVVTAAGVAETGDALAMAKDATEIYENAVIVQLDRDDASNAGLVNEWRLSGAPLPVILVVSSKGTVTGGFILSQASAEKIAGLVPSPKMEEVYTAIGSNKNAIVVFSKKSFSDRDEVVKNSKDAVDLLKNEAVFVEVDMDDPRESGFMKQVRIDQTTSTSVTLVINKQGQVAGTSITVPDPDKLVAAAKTPLKGGCGPGCGPAGCGK